MFYNRFLRIKWKLKQAKRSIDKEDERNTMNHALMHDLKLQEIFVMQSSSLLERKNTCERKKCLYTLLHL